MSRIGDAVDRHYDELERQLTTGNTHVFTGLVKLSKKYHLTMETIKPLQDVICRFK